MIPLRASSEPPGMDHGYARALRWQQAPRVRIELSRAVEAGFRFAGWAAVTALTVAGLFVVGFAMLGNFTFEGFFLQLANLADRYAAADLARRSSFLAELRWAGLVLLVGTAFFRRRSLARIFVDSKED